MSPGAPQEGALGEGESARDEVLQPHQEREEAGEQEEDDGVEVEEEEEETPTHLPFAPSSEVRASFSSLAQVLLLWRHECRLGRAFRRAVGDCRVASGYGGFLLADLLQRFFWPSAVLLTLVLLVMTCSCSMM